MCYQEEKNLPKHKEATLVTDHCLEFRLFSQTTVAF